MPGPGRRIGLRQDHHRQDDPARHLRHAGQRRDHLQRPRPTAIDVRKPRGRGAVPYRTRVQFVFQDPFGSLNPRMTVYDIITEPLVIHGIGDEAEPRERVKPS
jgi:ABC-type oligopeptide transport system ATPase subunit